MFRCQVEAMKKPFHCSGKRPEANTWKSESQIGRSQPPKVPGMDRDLASPREDAWWYKTPTCTSPYPAHKSREMGYNCSSPLAVCSWGYITAQWSLLCIILLAECRWVSPAVRHWGRTLCRSRCTSLPNCTSLIFVFHRVSWIGQKNSSTVAG